MAEQIQVIKKDTNLQEVWRYQGRVLERNANSITIEARFNRDDLDFHGVLIKRDDLFIETYYTDAGYNIFEIRDRDDGHLKGWYCNVTQPAEFDGDTILYVDLALDLLVKPDGAQLVLDEDEFEDLHLDEETRAFALKNLAKLSLLFREKFSGD